MTVLELTEALHLQIVVPGVMDRTITGGYTGDLLSWVMGRAGEGQVWITVMGNINALAVAVLADVSCILLAENAALDEAAAKRAAEEQIPILRSEQTTFNLSGELYRLLNY